MSFLIYAVWVRCEDGGNQLHEFHASPIPMSPLYALATWGTLEMMNDSKIEKQFAMVVKKSTTLRDTLYIIRSLIRLRMDRYLQEWTIRRRLGPTSVKN